MRANAQELEGCEMRVLELDWGEAAHIRSALVAAGSAGAYTMTRKESSAVPGVAMAI